MAGTASGSGRCWPSRRAPRSARGSGSAPSSCRGLAVRDLREEPASVYDRVWAPWASAGRVESVTAGPARRGSTPGRRPATWPPTCGRRAGPAWWVTAPWSRARWSAPWCGTAPACGRGSTCATPSAPRQAGRCFRAALLETVAMPDFLTTYAETQPTKLAVVDDRPDGTVLTVNFAELERAGQPPRQRPARPRRRPGSQGRVVRAELDRRRHRHERRPQDRRDGRAPQLPAVARGGGLRHRPLRRRDRLRRRRVRAALRAHPHRAPQGRPHPRVRRPGARRHAVGRRPDGGGVDRRAPGARDHRAGRHDDLHVGHHRASEGRAAAGHRRPRAGRGPHAR